MGIILTNTRLYFIMFISPVHIAQQFEVRKIQIILHICLSRFKEDNYIVKLTYLFGFNHS